jgi:hypothetical protein
MHKIPEINGLALEYVAGGVWHPQSACSTVDFFNTAHRLNQRELKNGSSNQG